MTEVAEFAIGEALEEAARLLHEIASLTHRINSLRVAPAEATVSWAWNGAHFNVASDDQRNAYGVQTDKLIDDIRAVVGRHLRARRSELIRQLPGSGVLIAPAWWSKIEGGPTPGAETPTT